MQDDVAAGFTTLGARLGAGLAALCDASDVRVALPQVPPKLGVTAPDQALLLLHLGFLIELLGKAQHDAGKKRPPLAIAGQAGSALVLAPQVLGGVRQEVIDIGRHL